MTVAATQTTTVVNGSSLPAFICNCNGIHHKKQLAFIISHLECPILPKIEVKRWGHGILTVKAPKDRDQRRFQRATSPI